MTIIIDANIFIKLFLDEDGHKEARAFFKQAALSDAVLLAPSLFRYEVWEIARRNNIPLNEINHLIELQQRTVLKMVEPSIEHVLKAEQIASHGTRQSGFPSIYDSIYHAIALIEGGQFLTADSRHAAKVKKFGALTLLKDWQTLFSG